MKLEGSKVMTRLIRDIRTVFLINSGLLIYFAYVTSYSVIRYVLTIAAVLLLLIVVYSPLRLLSAFGVWRKYALFIGRINTMVLLVILFAFVLFPTGMVIRLLGFDPLQRKSKRATLWEPYELAGLKDKCRYEHQY